MLSPLSPLPSKSPLSPLSPLPSSLSSKGHKKPMSANRGQGHLSQGNAPLNGVNGVNGNGNGFQGVEMPVVNQRQNKGLFWPLKGDSLVKGKALLKSKDVRMSVIIFFIYFYFYLFYFNTHTGKVKRP